MQHCCLAADLGASGGRVMAATLENSIISLQEIHRFPNQFEDSEQGAVWDVDQLFDNICQGIRRARHLNPESIGVDTWGVDYVVVDQLGQRVALAYAYRDPRTNGMIQKVAGEMPLTDIYQRTGIEFMELNTLYQLYAQQQQMPETLEPAHTLLFSPDYYHFRLCGKACNETSIASTSQMLNAFTGEWDPELLKVLGISPELFSSRVSEGTVLGSLKPELASTLGIDNLKVVTPAGHDTACAIAAVPVTQKNWAFISSGTWSVMGVERSKPLINSATQSMNMTNERGVGNTFRLQKNLTGLWLIQCVQKELAEPMSFAELAEQARAANPFESLINPNDPCFSNPGNMTEAIQNYCRKTEQPVPDTPGALARCIFESLACSYRQVKMQLESVSNEAIEHLYLIGGGTYNEFLNQLTADACNTRVFAGPSEASALGNALTQFIGVGAIESIKEARRIVANSFTIREYQPCTSQRFNSAFDRYCLLTGLK